MREIVKRKKVLIRAPVFPNSLMAGLLLQSNLKQHILLRQCLE